MVRLSMVVLCLVLAAAAAGRYQAEIAVRNARHAIEKLKAERVSELRQVQTLRAEIAYLENPQRLSALSAKLPDLKPVSGGQVLTADAFRAAFATGLVPTQSEPAFAAAPAKRVSEQRVALADARYD